MKAKRAETLRGIYGNPTGETLHEVMTEIEDWLAYESKVVEAAAEEIADPDISEAAEDQAEAMEAAADAVGDAVEAAQETAAEVFSEGDGEPAADATGSEGDAVSGNPSDWYKEGHSRGKEYEGDPVEAPDPLSGEWAGESIPEIFGSWEEATDEAMDDYERGYWDAVIGNPTGTKYKRSVRLGNPGLSSWKDFYALEETKPGTWNIESMATGEVVETVKGEWEDAQREADSIYRDVVLGNPSDNDDYESWDVIGPGDEVEDFPTYAEAVAYANELADELEAEGFTTDRSLASSGNYFALRAEAPGKRARYVAVEGNPGESPIPPPEPGPGAIATVAEVAPEPAHWYTKSLGKVR